MDQELKQYLDAKFAELDLKLERWAAPADARARTRAAVLRVMDLELEALTQRLKKLEGNVN